jgi:alkanesulfonate monooxygenase SsuD/methylene tetrahydromethanopterin reductase-like flavin-dependent oxidoreductase (luciferase family)
MRAYHFTEMPYPFVPEEVERAWGTARVTIPNRYCDPRVAADLYHRYLDEYLYADDLGLDLMLNEHHQTMTCLDTAVPLTAAIVARETRNARLAIIGTPIVHRDNPVRVAEEIAMLDCLSRGRIISGFVRGVGTEIHPANTNPVQQRERMQEAHDLILKAWTTGEPFNWEGRFFHYRYVNVWPRPYQQPHPPVWVTGSSPESVAWVADRQYTFACFLAGYEGTAALFQAYRQRCQERGLPEPTSDKMAYAALCYTAETDEAAQEYGQQLLWYLYRERHGFFTNPPGYTPDQALAKAMLSGTARPYREPYDSLQEKGIVLVGSPDTMIKKITRLYEQGHVGHLLMMNQAGFMDTQHVRRSLKLFAREVYPAIRRLGEQEGAREHAVPTT